MSELSLEALFLRAGGKPAPQLAAALASALAGAQAARPELPPPPPAFVEHLARHAAEGPTGLSSVGDLYLAWACAQGQPTALALLEQLLKRAATAAVRGGGPAVPADEVHQVLLERLLVGGGTRGLPRILDYAGQAPLERWLKVAAVRTALNLREAAGSAPQPSREGELPERAGPDAELAFLKQHYAREFREAFDAALGALDVDQRNVLRLHFLDGLSIDQLGGVYGVHRATAARWVVRGRKALLDETRARLRERWRMSEPELDSVLRQVRSQLDVTLRWLRNAPPPDSSAG